MMNQVRDEAMRTYWLFAFLLFFALRVGGKAQGSTLLVPQLQISEEDRPVVLSLLHRYFGEGARSPFITIFLTPQVCARCEYTLVPLLERLMSLDSALNNRIALVLHGVSAKTVAVLRQLSPYSAFSKVYYLPEKIARKFLPSGIPYFVVWDAQGKVLFSTAALGFREYEKLDSVVVRALHNAQPLQIPRRVEIALAAEPDKVAIKLFPEKLISVERAVALQADSLYPQEGDQSVTWSLDGRYLLAFNQFLKRLGVYSVQEGKLLAQFPLPDSLVTRFVVVDSGVREQLRRLGILEPISIGLTFWDDTTVLQEMFLPKIFYYSQDNQRRLGAATQHVLVRYHFASGQLTVDTLVVLPDTLNMAILMRSFAVNRTILFGAVGKGIPFESYYHAKQKSVLDEAFYKHAYPFVHIDPVTGQIARLPMTLPKIHQDLRVGYSPTGLRSVATSIAPGKYVVATPVSEYLWVYDTQAQNVDTFLLHRWDEIRAAQHRAKELLDSLQRVSGDTAEYMRQYAQHIGTLADIFALQPVALHAFADSIVAVVWVRYRSGSEWHQRSVERYLLEFYDMRTWQLVGEYQFQVIGQQPATIALQPLHWGDARRWGLCWWDGNHLIVQRMVLAVGKMQGGKITMEIFGKGGAVLKASGKLTLCPIPSDSQVCGEVEICEGKVVEIYPAARGAVLDLSVECASGPKGGK